MTYTLVIELVNFKEWTESVGDDREWYIQLIQSKIYYKLQSYVKDLNGIALPLRYDIQLALLPGDLDVYEVTKYIVSLLKPYSPTEIRVSAFCGLPHNVFRVGSTGSNSGGCALSYVCVAHADLNYFTLKTIGEGVYASYVEVLNILSRLTTNLVGKAVVQYLGGDNLVIITDPSLIDLVINEVTGVNDIKVGIGVSYYPRRAFELAAKALRSIRHGGRGLKYLVIKD